MNSKWKSRVSKVSKLNLRNHIGTVISLNLDFMVVRVSVLVSKVSLNFKVPRSLNSSTNSGSIKEGL